MFSLFKLLRFGKVLHLYPPFPKKVLGHFLFNFLEMCTWAEISSNLGEKISLFFDCN